MRVDPRDHVGLVYREANRFASPQEFVGAGYLGLVRACRSFDPDRGIAFSTHAAFCIRGEILNDFPRAGRPRPHDNAIALDTIDVVADRPGALEQLADEGIYTAVRSAVQSPGVLTARERRLILWRYWHDERQAAIARRLRCSEGRVSQLLSSARAKLRPFLESLVA